MSQILVVDDKAIYREPLAEALRRRGYKTICAEGGRSAFHALARDRPDLILLDLAMPEIDGLAFLRALRKRPDYRTTPVIVLTAVSERSKIVEAARLGVQAYMLKGSFSLSHLLDRVEACLQGRCRAASAQAAPEPAKRTAPAPASAPPEAAAATATAPVAVQSSSGNPPARTTPTAAAAEVRVIRDSRQTREALMELKTEMTREELRALVQRGLELRPLASSVQKLMSILSRSGCSVDEVARCIGQDQALSVRILRLANGSMYSRGKSIESLKDAVSRIGLEEVRNVAMTLAVLQQYEGEVAHYLDPRLFWEHCIACGVIAHELNQVGQWVQGDCFLLGMLHDVGRLVLVEHVPDRYISVWARAQELDLPLEAVEGRLLLVDHCQVLEQALAYWQFGQELIAPLTNHHTPLERIRRLGASQAHAAAIIALANRLAHALLIGDSGNCALYPFEELVEYLELSPETLQEIIEKAPHEANALKYTMLCTTSDSDWPDASARVRAMLPEPTRVLYHGLEHPLDAFRLFFDRLAPAREDEPPQVGVVYVPDTRKLEAALQTFERLEESSGVARLPLLVLYGKGKPDHGAERLRGRSCALLQTPARVETLATTIRDMVSSREDG
jgi:HD-like signal output (HDOD) protein/DNA-binding response OmpR family regulator